MTIRCPKCAAITVGPEGETIILICPRCDTRIKVTVKVEVDATPLDT